MNSAYEIAVVLERFAATAANTPLSTCWAMELQCVEGSADYFLALAVLQSKMEGLRREIEISPIGDRSKQLYTTAIDKLLRCVRANQVNGFSTAELQKLKTHVDLLFVASDQLPNSLVPEVNSVTITELIKQIEDVIAAAQTAEIEPQIRQIIVAQLSTLIMSVRSFSVLGPEGTAKIFGSVAAELLRAAGLPPSQSPAAQTIFGKTKSVVTKVGSAIVFAGAVVSGAHAFLTDGSDILGIKEQPAQEATDAPSAHPTALPAVSGFLAQSDTQQSGEG